LIGSQNIDEMKYFKCGNCQAPYKIDEATITKVQVAINCPKCGVKNIIRLGPFLVVQSKDKIQQFPLKRYDKFDISHNKDKAAHLFFYGAGCGTDRMKNFLTGVFQEYFKN
jgi:DNA-directed RNA polymerase subunit RPC12/RpoP